MEKVSFSYYSHSPRLKVEFNLELHTVPVKGDYIHIKGEHISACGKDIPNRDLLLEQGGDFIVIMRTKHLSTKCGEDWRITIEPMFELTKT